MLLAHGRTAGYLKSKGKKVGIVCCGDAPYPVTETKENIEAARSEMFSNGYLWHLMNIFDPIFLGDYDKSFYQKYGDIACRFIRDSDREIIFGNTDYCCMNHYNGYPVAGENGKTNKVRRTDGYPMTAIGWPVDEKGVYWMLKFLQERYRKPLLLTENGMSNFDFVYKDGKVHDLPRIEYFEKYLGETERCLKNGIDLRGYFAWSLLDNFEWLAGFSQRFGLVYVDYETKRRIPKDSFYYYAEYIKAHRDLHTIGVKYE